MGRSTWGRRRRAVAFGLFAMSAAAFGPALLTPVAAAGLPGAVAVDHPAGIAFRGNDLVVAVTSKGEVQDINAAGTATTLIGSLSPGAMDRGVTGVAVDAAGDVFAGATDDGTIYAVTPDGRQGPYARGLGAPYGMAFGSDGTLYVADAASRQVVAVGPDHSVHSLAALGDTPFGLAIGPSGDIFVSELRTGKIDRVTAAGNVSTYATLAVPNGSILDAEGIAFDSAGSLYVGAGAGDPKGSPPASTGHVVVIPPGGGTAVEVAANLAGPLNLAFAPDGSSSLYVAAQAEGVGTTKNKVMPVTTPLGGMPLAHPTVAISFLPVYAPHARVFSAGGAPLDPSAFAGDLPVPYIADIGYPAGEPMISITHQGTVYMNAINFSGSPCVVFPHSRLRGSNDGGRTFADVTPALADPTKGGAPPCSLDPYLFYDRGPGRLFYADLVGQCTDVSITDDNGKTWSSGTPCGPAALDDHETLAAGPPPKGTTTSGYPNMVYYCWQSVAYNGCDPSTDGGHTYTDAVGVPYRSGDTCENTDFLMLQNGGQTGHAVVGSDGTLYLPKGDCGPGPMVAESTDAGLTWTQVLVHPSTVAQNMDHESAIALDKAGNAYFVWIDAHTLLPHLAVSHDRGRTWPDSFAIAPPGLTEADQPAITAGADGRVAVYFYGTTGDCCYGRPRDETQTGSDAVAGEPSSAWNAYMVLSVDANAGRPHFAATPMRDPRQPLLRGNCGPGRCSNSYDFWDIEGDDNGRLWVSMTNECVKATCSKPGLTGAVDGAAEGFAGQLLCGPRVDATGNLTAPSWASVTCGPAAATAPVATPPPTPLPPTLTNTSGGHPVPLWPFVLAAGISAVGLLARHRLAFGREESALGRHRRAAQRRQVEPLQPPRR